MEIMLGILLALAIVGLVASPIILTRLHQKIEMDLNDRLGAKSLEDYKYWREVYPRAVEKEEVKEKARNEMKKKLSPADLAAHEMARGL